MSEHTKVQHTVSFDISAISEEAFAVLRQFEFVAVGDRIDMEEGEFFNFKEEVEAYGLTLPVDGSNPWEKHV